ncbi:carbohydrate ABC transporter permease [Alicyclobacillus fodiniaquatilis]|uniref:Carbohydrate ABC transporter permease n=1 Tax=Alicyclobacillus fodiniaquatilis TaxID=1661150 RepID=A0ABW4JLB0_9BACL
MARAKFDKSRYGYLFIAPFFIVFIIFGLYPILDSLYLSFTNWDGFTKPVAAGVANYKRLIHDSIFLHSILNTFIMWIISIVPQLILALVLALVLNEKFVKGKHLFRAIFYFPNIVTPVTIGVLVSLMFDWKTGSINKMLVAMHLVSQPVNWFGHPLLAQIIVAGILCWQNFGYNMLIFTAGLQSISTSVYEAAEMDGATKFQTALHITIPMLKPVLIFTGITSIIGGMQNFAVPLMIGNVPGNATQTMVSYLYTTAFQHFQYGYGSAVAYGVFILIMVLSLISLRMTTRKQKTSQA